MEKPDWSDDEYQGLFNLFLARADKLYPGKLYPSDRVLSAVENIKYDIDLWVDTLADKGSQK